MIACPECDRDTTLLHRRVKRPSGKPNSNFSGPFKCHKDLQEKKRNTRNTTKIEPKTTLEYVVLGGNISINCNYRSCKDKLTNPTYINQWYPSASSSMIRTLSASNKTWQNHCGSCANLISLIADMRLSRTEWAKQRGSKKSVRKRKQDNEFKKEITRS